MDPYHRLSIAPMMAYTDRHYRWMMRLFTKKTLLYTEMVVGTTITHNLNNSFLKKVLSFDPVEHPIAVQLGGDDAEILKTSAKVCEDYGYDEINLNIGCPSDRVQKGRFGVCLMQEPEKVADIVAAIQSVVKIPVTVKHRIGVDHDDNYEFMHRFVETVAAAGCSLFIVHARKAWLQGLSPAQNRSVPPLLYDRVYQLKKDFPHLDIIINGGIMDLEETKTHLEKVDGVMIGRAAYQHPEMFTAADHLIFGDPPGIPLSHREILAKLDAYIGDRVAEGDKFSLVAKHLVGMFKNQRGSRRWRQRISQLVQSKPSTFSLEQVYRETMMS